MDEARRCELERVALEVKKDVVRMAGVARLRALASAHALTDLLVYLYWERMKIFPGERNRRDRDRLVLSDPSASPALYACLARRGFFEREELWSYRRLGAILQGYPDIRTPGVDAPGGTSGLGIALGLSIALRADGEKARVYCVMDAGALRLGSTWESIAEAAPQGVNPCLVIGVVHAEGVPKDSFFADVQLIEGRRGSFGWATTDADGHDFPSMEDAFREADIRASGPVAVVVRTRLDVSALHQPGEAENPLSADEVERALSQLDSGAPEKGDTI
jgi:transketolase